MTYDQGRAHADTPLVVATDGSSTGASPGIPRQAGFAYFAHEAFFDYGPAHIEANPEHAAIRALLLDTPSDRALHIVTDCSEAILRFVEGIAPKQTQRDASEWVDTMSQVRSRDVTFTQVIAAEGRTPPEHAMAHYLAFLGRLGRRPVPGQPAPGLDRILSSPDPNQTAHDMVVEHLFPRRAAR